MTRRRRRGRRGEDSARDDSGSTAGDDERALYGVHTVSAALERFAGGDTTREPRRLFVGREARVTAVAERAEALGVAVEPASAAQLEQLAHSRSHQGVVALLPPFPYVALEDLLLPSPGADAASSSQPLLLLVDGVTDPQNLGAMFRSALVLGASGVVLTRDRCAPVTATVARVASGATEHLPCARVTNLARAADALKQAGLWLAATVESGGQDPAAVDLAIPLALLLGSEDRGVRPILRKRADLLLTIPSEAPFAALNVATATAVALYEVARQRRAASKG